MECTCPQCSSLFEITEEDIAFLKRISPVIEGVTYELPPPTLCERCRLQRRMTWRNDRHLYERKDDFSGEKLLSMYRPGSIVKIMRQDTWWEDDWDPLDYGMEYDFSRPFFKQFNDLQAAVPRPNQAMQNAENADYTNYTNHNRNCYLCFAGNYLQDSYYCYNTQQSKDCCDCHFVYDSELCYECVQSERCFNTTHSLHVAGCTDCHFLEDCSECTNCVLCCNLHRKQYCIRNQQLTKEEYEKQLKEMRLDTHSGIEKVKTEWEKYRLEFPKRSHHSRNAEDCSGEYMSGCARCKDCYSMAKDCEDCLRIFNGFPGLKDSMDCLYCGDYASRIYESVATGDSCQSLYFCHIGITGSDNLLYCDFVTGSSNCFGCIGLRNSEYCILNKRYSKEQYAELIPKIVEHMKSTGEWGEFFPAKLSPFAYNESFAQDYFPLEKKEVLKSGLQWYEADEAIPDVQKVISASQLPDQISAIPDDICNWAIECEVTKRPYRVVRQELEFYRKMKLPVSHFHQDVRHAKRVSQRNSHVLHDRKCDKCDSPIRTSYKEGRSEKVYCESCYLEEVY